MQVKVAFASIAAGSLLVASAAGSVDPRPPSGARFAEAVPTDPQVPIAYLVDLSSGAVLHARNDTRRFVPASITKVMTLFVAFEMIAAGELDPSQHFPISDQAFSAWDNVGSTMFITAGSTVSVDNLLRGIATVSANDGSVVLAEGAAGSVAGWVARMNVAARELGMRDSHFGTPNGWADEGRTFTSARDLAVLGSAMISRHPELYARYIGQAEFSYNGISQPNRDPISGSVNGADGIKTGFTNQAGHGFLGSAVRDGRRLMMVVAGAESNRARNRLARDLIEWGFARTRARVLFASGEVIGQALVQGGEVLSVPLMAGNSPISAAQPDASGNPDVTLTIRYDGPLRAPIAEGEKVADLEISVAGMPTSHAPLYAAQDVGKAGSITRFKNGLAGLFRW